MDPFTAPYHFDWLEYEVRNLWAILEELLPGSRPSSKASSAEEYFALGPEISRLSQEVEEAYIQGASAQASRYGERLDSLRDRRALLEDGVERLLESQIHEVLADEGITLVGNLVIPPVQFEFETPPWLLVLSRRDRIETLERLSLRPNFSLAEIEDIERRADALGVSALIVPTGGMASYPPIVTEESDLVSTLGAAVHEWVHNFLFFFPLGQHYDDSQDLITMNETVASLVEEEISGKVLERYYPELHSEWLSVQEAATTSEAEQERPEGFDFNFHMRETRLRVDDLLAEEKIVEAERYMEERRRGLEEHGIYIRKINQAYFSFYGSYATEPSAVSPIGEQLRELRRRSGSLAQFLRTVAQMTSHEDLLATLGEQAD